MVTLKSFVLHTNSEVDGDKSFGELRLEVAMVKKEGTKEEVETISLPKEQTSFHFQQIYDGHKVCMMLAFFDCQSIVVDNGYEDDDDVVKVTSSSSSLPRGQMDVRGGGLRS